jgi:hypothetical protein
MYSSIQPYTGAEFSICPVKIGRDGAHAAIYGSRSRGGGGGGGNW